MLDEIVLNVIRHGHDDQGEHEIHVRLRAGPDAVTIMVEDDGKPFNPLDAPPPNLDLPIEQRPIGGLGIFLVKSLDQRHRLPPRGRPQHAHADEAATFLSGRGALQPAVSRDTSGSRIKPVTAASVFTGTISGYGITAGIPNNGSPAPTRRTSDTLNAAIEPGEVGLPIEQGRDELRKEQHEDEIAREEPQRLHALDLERHPHRADADRGDRGANHQLHVAEREIGPQQPRAGIPAEHRSRPTGWTTRSST